MLWSGSGQRLPDYLFRGISPNSGSGDPRLNNEKGVTPYVWVPPLAPENGSVIKPTSIFDGIDQGLDIRDMQPKVFFGLVTYDSSTKILIPSRPMIMCRAPTKKQRWPSWWGNYLLGQRL